VHINGAMYYFNLARQVAAGELRSAPEYPGTPGTGDPSELFRSEGVSPSGGSRRRKTKRNVNKKRKTKGKGRKSRRHR